MDDDSFLDDSISILDDTQLASDSCFGDGAAAAVPQFHIYTRPEKDISEASHYALYLSCQTLKKRNRELEQQLAKLQKMVSKFSLVSSFELESCPASSESVSELSFRKGPTAKAKGEMLSISASNYIRYLEDKLKATEQANAGLVAETEKQKTIALGLKEPAKLQQELLNKLQLKIKELNTENKELKLRLGEKCNKLKTVEGGYTVKYEHEVRELNKNSDSLAWPVEEKVKKLNQLQQRQVLCQQEKETLKGMFSGEDENLEGKFDLLEQAEAGALPYCDKCNREFDVPDKATDQHWKEMLQFYKQLIGLRSSVISQSKVIKQLVTTKRQNEIQDKQCELANNLDFAQSAPVNCGADSRSQLKVSEDCSDQVYDSLGCPELEDISISEQNSPGSGAEDYVCAEGPDLLPQTADDLPQVVDNRLNTAVSSAQTRTIEIERNINCMESCPPSNRLQNVNLIDMMQDKQTGLDDGQRDLMNNGPLVSTKHIPTCNIYASKTCPLCEMCFSAEMKQADFEKHVQDCLGTSQTSDYHRSPAGDEASSADSRQCPVCECDFPQHTSQEEFESHVNSHFDDEDETM